MLLDEVVLEDERFEFGLADDELDVPDARHQAPGLGVQPLLLEVGLHPVAQHLGLAHVEQVAALVPVEVATGAQGQIPQLPFQEGGLLEVGAHGGHGRLSGSE